MSDDWQYTEEESVARGLCLNAEHRELEAEIERLRHRLMVAWTEDEYYAEVERLRAEVVRKDEALRHYAEELHWSLEPDDRPEATTKPYYPTFVYDGGHDEPWAVARAALGVSEEPSK